MLQLGAPADRSAQTGVVDLGEGVGVHYRILGEGTGDALVLLHGAGPGVSGWSNFAATAPAFADRFLVVVPDLPGFGASTCPPLDRPYPQVAADAVAGVLDALGVRRAHLLGNSMGAFVAAELALARPERVDRLVLMGFGGIAVNVLAPAPSEGGRRSREFVANPGPTTLLAWLETMVEQRELLTDELVAERLAAALSPGAVEHLAAVRRSMATPADGEPPRWALTGRLDRPTLLVWGRDDRMVPWEHALLPLRQMPNVELRVFSGCGHWAQVERKVEFERVVREFLTRGQEGTP